MISHTVKKYSNFLFHKVEMPNSWQRSTLLVSKVSEALNPDTPQNEVGEGGTFEDILKVQKNILFLMSAGFNHYRKNFYIWPHSDFNEGDPVGLVKIREHVYRDQLDPTNYGYFVQKEKGSPWQILKEVQHLSCYKYILGCTPLLVYNKIPFDLSHIQDTPVKAGEINPPSYLGHKDQKHARALVGLKENILVYIIVEGPGCTLKELQELAIAENLDYALNLDGGGSAKFMLKQESGAWVKSASSKNEENRVLGHVIILFDNVKS